MNLEGIENREWRRNNRESSLHSRLDSLFSILDSREDRESSVNLLLNGTNVQMYKWEDYLAPTKSVQGPL